jgi:hypothetical protein
MITKEIKEVFDDGAVRIIGRDKNYFRPVLLVDTQMIDPDRHPKELIAKAISLALVFMEDYMFFPGKIESLIAIISNKDQRIFKEFPLEYL